MNNDSNNQYQDNQTYVNPNNNNTQGYNDTYYNNDYNNNSYNNTGEQPQNSKSNLFKILLIVFLIAVVGIGVFYFFGKNNNGEKEYAELTKRFCDAALEYQSKNPDIIDTDTPGSTAYITLEKLANAYLIDSQIKDPRQKSQNIPLTTYVRLAVASNGEVYCESVVDTGDDKTAPILTLVGGSEITILKGTNFEDPGAKALDNVDGDITNKITRSGNVDVTKAGDYTITYRITDTSGNSASKERKILVREYKDLDPTAAANLDVTPPQIEVKGYNPLCLQLGKKYVEPGVIAIDNVDGNITNRIIVDNKVTGERTGTFRVTYEVEDTAGNKTVAYRSVEVKTTCGAVVPPSNPTPVNTRPTISLIGGPSVVWNLNEPYVDRGATAWDREDGDLTRYIRVDATKVNVAVPGIYDVYYEVIDSKGLKASEIRKLTVVDTGATSNPPIAHFLEMPSDLRVPVGSPRDISIPRAQDDRGNGLAVTVTVKGPAGNVIPSVNFYTVGVYTVIYTAKPAGGIEQSVSRIVDVYDTAAPILNAPATITLQKRSINCSLTVEDLTSAGVTATDSSNSKAARIVINNNSISVCAVNSAGTDIQVYAVDDYGNKSAEKTIKVIITEANVPIDVTGVSILNCGTNKEIRMNIGGTTPLNATVYPANATNKNVTWSSINTAVATVNSSGVISAVAKGSTDIKVTTASGTNTDTCTVIVEDATTPVPVTDLILEGCESGALTMNKGMSRNLVAVVKPDNATNKATGWTSSDLAIVSLNANGYIKAENVGTATVTVTTNDGNIPKTCAITVREASTTPDSTPPTKVAVTGNTANTTDPYNTNGSWFGGVGKKEIKLTVEATDSESNICSYEIQSGSNTITFNPLASSSGGSKGEYTWKTDTNQDIKIRAVNCVSVPGEYSDPVTIKLDNVGPSTTFTQAIQNANTWVNTSTYVVKYAATDTGVGLDKYQYTYDDVHAANFDPTRVNIEGETTVGEATFAENLIKNNVYVKYVYVRAVDKLGNFGEWTANPSWLNMDSVAPNAPGLTVANNNTAKVSVTFSFSDKTSPKPSGFGKFTYKLNERATVDTTNTQINLTVPGTYKVEAWAFDKAGNQSQTSAKQEGLKVLPGLEVSCPKTSMVEDTSMTCSLSGTYANEVGVKLECLIGTAYYKASTTTASNKSVTCKPSLNGSMVVKATKTGFIDGRYSVTVTKASAPPPATVNVTGVTIQNCGTNNQITLKVGEGRNLDQTVSPSDATNKTVAWSTSSTSIATVSSTGDVTAVAVGTANIKVKTNSGAEEAVCKVTVEAVTNNNQCTLGSVKDNSWTQTPLPTTAASCDSVTGGSYIGKYTYQKCVSTSAGNRWESQEKTKTATIGTKTSDYANIYNISLSWSLTAGESPTGSAVSSGAKTGKCTGSPTPAKISCTNTAVGNTVTSGTTITRGTGITCTSASPNVVIKCYGSGNNSEVKSDPRTCSASVAGNDLKFEASAPGYTSTIVSFPVVVPKVTVSCVHNGETLGMRKFHCTVNPSTGGQLHIPGWNWEAAPHDYDTGSNTIGTERIVYGRATNYAENSVKICEFPNINDGCSYSELNKTVCSGTVAPSRTCKGLNKRWVYSILTPNSGCPTTGTIYDDETKARAAFQISNYSCEQKIRYYYRSTDSFGSPTCRYRDATAGCDYKWQ